MFAKPNGMVQIDCLKPAMALLAMLVFAGGCLQEEAPSEEPPPKLARTRAPAHDACNSISVDRVKFHTGVSGVGQPSISGGAALCTWASPDGRKSVTLHIFPSPAYYERSREVFEERQGVKSLGLNFGDRAFYVGGKVGDMETAAVSARRRNATVSVEVKEMNGSPRALRVEASGLTREMLGVLMENIP